MTEIMQIQKEKSQIEETLFPNSSIHIAKQFELYLNGIYMMDWYRQKLIHQEFNQNPGKVKDILVEFINLKLDKSTVKQILIKMQAKNVRVWNIYRVLKPYFGQFLDEQSIEVMHHYYLKKNIKSRAFQKYLNQFRNARIALFEPYIEKLQNYPSLISENNKAFIQKMLRKNTKRKLTNESPEKDKEEIAEAETQKSQAASVQKNKSLKVKKGKNKKNNIYQIDQGIIFEEEGEKDQQCSFEMIEKYYADSSIPMMDIDPQQILKFDIDEILALSRYQPTNMPNNNDIQSEVESIEQIDQSSKERLAHLKNLWNLNCLDLAYKSLIFYNDGKIDPFAETLEFNNDDPFKIS